MFWVSKECSCNHGKSDLELYDRRASLSYLDRRWQLLYVKGGIVMQQTDDAGGALDGGYHMHSPLVNARVYEYIVSRIREIFKYKFRISENLSKCYKELGVFC